jgi:hypothetical protein
LHEKAVGDIDSISSTFYTRLLGTKVLREAFLFGFLFVIFWRKNIGAKADLKMLVK